MYIRASTKRRIYQREPYKILDLMGDLGGLLEIGLAIGKLLTFSFVQDAFYRSILGQTYQVQNYAENKSEFYKSEKATRCSLSNTLYKSSIS